MCITNVNITYYNEDDAYTFKRFKVESVGGRSWHIGNKNITLTERIREVSKEHCRKFGITDAVDNITTYNYILEEEILVNEKGDLQAILIFTDQNKHHVICVDVDAEEQLNVSSIFQTKSQAMECIYQWLGV